ncbi:MAG: fatty acid desaturase CarF family protein [Candidatus Gracilibacteria bacterium]
MDTSSKNASYNSLLEVFLLPLATFVWIAESIYIDINAFKILGLIWFILVFFISIPISIIISDFISGLVHWFCDSYGTKDTFLIGPLFIQNFRQHHLTPLGMCKSNFFGTIGHAALVASILLGCHLLLLFLLPASTPIAVLSIILVWISFFGVLTNLFHKWSHQIHTSTWVKILQKSHVVLAPKHHRVHHTPPFEHYYCITTGWLNPLLERINFFPKMEKLLAKCHVYTTRDK